MASQSQPTLSSTMDLSHDRQRALLAPGKLAGQARAWPEFVALRTLPERLAAATGHVLGVVHFARGPRQAGAAVPACVITMSQCGGEEVAEVWLSHTPVNVGNEGNFQYAHNEDLFFCVLHLPDDADSGIEGCAHEGYARLLDFAAAKGFPHFLRMWNHFPAINRETCGLERYRQFCVGRYQAFAEHRYAFAHDLPAASAVGTPLGEGLIIYCLASRTPGAQIENPRQVSAFQYPAQYGPRSPSFSRAILKAMGSERQLYISGTASIVGHETLHVGDVTGQLQETLRNIDAVLGRASAGQQTLRMLTRESLFKVYLRDPADLETVNQGLAGALGAASVLCVQGDICRMDLLLEIEAVIRWSDG